MKRIQTLSLAVCLAVITFAASSCSDAHASNDAGAAVYEAILNDDLESARRLLSENTGARYRDEDGASLLHMSVVSEDLELVRQCVENGIDVNLVNGADLTPLDYVLYLIMTAEQTGANARALESIGEYLETKGGRSEGWEALRQAQEEVLQDVRDSMNRPFGY